MSWSNQPSAPVFAPKIGEINSALPLAKLNSGSRTLAKVSALQDGSVLESSITRQGSPISNTLYNRKSLKTLRRTLRSSLTPAEARLWSALKGKRLDGRKFRRQQSIDRYVVDFSCPQEKLVIELDGQVHGDPLRNDYDGQRQATLESLGLTVLRFENRMVFEQLDNVLEQIRREFKESEE